MYNYILYKIVYIKRPGNPYVCIQDFKIESVDILSSESEQAISRYPLE